MFTAEVSILVGFGTPTFQAVVGSRPRPPICAEVAEPVALTPSAGVKKGGGLATTGVHKAGVVKAAVSNPPLRLSVKAEDTSAVSNAAEERGPYVAPALGVMAIWLVEGLATRANTRPPRLAPLTLGRASCLARP